MITNLCLQEFFFPQNHQTPHRPVPHLAPHRSARTAVSGYSPTTTRYAWGPSHAPRRASRASFAGMPVANISAWCREMCCAASRQLHRRWWGNITPLPRVYRLTGPPHTHTHTYYLILPYHIWFSCGEQSCENISSFYIFLFHFAIEMTSFQFIRVRNNSSSVVSSPNRSLFSVLQQKAKAN